MSSRRHNENYLPVVYKVSSRTIPRMSKMCVYRHIFVFWVPAVDDASGRYSLWCSVLNWKINTTSWPSRGTLMKTAYCRLCFAVFAIYVQRHTYVWYVFKMPLLWIDDNGCLCGDTKNRQRLNYCIGEHLIPYAQTMIHKYPLILWSRQILI